MMLLKFCPQWVNKLGKLSRGHRTGKSQFSFQFQRKVMPKNVQTTIRLHSVCMTVRLCSKSFKLGFSIEAKESWVPKMWCFQIVVLEKTLESPLDSKEIKPVNLNGRTDAEAEALVLWPSDLKSQLIGKDPDAEKDWGQEKKGMTKDEMVGQHHHQLNGHKFEQTLGDGERQGSRVCCRPWGFKESDMT